MSLPAENLRPPATNRGLSISPVEGGSSMTSIPQISKLGQVALAYARRFNWAVLPLHSVKNGRCTCGKADCPSPGKHPLIPHGVADATKDPATIAAWWKRWPWANIGVATGQASGFFVLDVDGEEGEESLRDLKAQHGKLPDTVEALTGGGGRHLLFRYPEGRSIGNKVAIAPGLDVRGVNGYIVAPPSLHVSGRRYEWEVSSRPTQVEIAEAPEWLLNLVCKSENGGRLAPEDWQCDIPEGGRNNELTRRAGSLLARGIPAGEALTMLLAWNERHCKPPLPEREVRAIVESIAKREAAKPDKERGEAKPEPAVKLWTTEELANADFPEPAWLVPGILPEEGLVLLAGKPKVGKSWLALDIATGLATGGTVCGVPAARQVRALYLALEDTPRRLKNRLAVAGFSPSNNCLIATAWPRLGAGGLELLEKAITEHGAGVVIIDTLAKLRPREGKITSLYAADYEVLGVLKELADRLGITVVVVHHLRKAGAEDPLEEVSGTTGLTGAVDTVLILKRGRGEADGTLFITGRDVEESEIALRFHHGCWQVLGEAREYAMSQERRQLLDAIRELGGAAKPKEIAELLGKNHNTVKVLLRKLETEGVVNSVGGCYCIAPVYTNSINPVNPINSVNPVNPVTPVYGLREHKPSVNPAEALSDKASQAPVYAVYAVYGEEHKPSTMHSGDVHSPCSPCSPVNTGERRVNGPIHPVEASSGKASAASVNAVNGEHKPEGSLNHNPKPTRPEQQSLTALLEEIREAEKAQDWDKVKGLLQEIIHRKREEAAQKPPGKEGKPNECLLRSLRL